MDLLLVHGGIILTLYKGTYESPKVANSDDNISLVSIILSTFIIENYISLLTWQLWEYYSMLTLWMVKIVVTLVLQLIVKDSTWDGSYHIITH